MVLINLLGTESWGLHDVLRPLAWLGLGICLGRWLRMVLTASKFMELFESEGSFSLRLVLAGEIIIWMQFMDAAGRLTDPMRDAWLIFDGTLLGLGVGKIVAKEWAKRPPTPDTSISMKAENATATTESGNIVLGKQTEQSAPAPDNTDANQQPILP